METQNTPNEKQIFVCTNNKNGEGASCGDHNAEAIFRELRNIAKEKGLHPRIRVAQAKCLGQCQKGANIMVYPDNMWYSNVELSDVPKIAEIYLK